MKSHSRFAAAFAVVLCLVSTVALAQTTGNLTGTVTTGGSPLPGVTVTISSPNLQGTRSTQSDVNGNYNFGALPPGRYEVAFEIEGMAPLRRTANVDVAATARADGNLALTAVEEAITVTADAPSVVETSEVQTTLEASVVEQLPINRNLLATVTLAPGTNVNGPAGATTISGAQSFDSVFYIDGAVVNEVLRGQPLDLFIEDALQETTILTGGVSAEYGRFTGGVVTAVSKSGGNEFSGSIRDNVINPSWQEETPLGEDEGDDDMQQTYEATLGGRIIRDRLWFFTAGRFFEREEPQFLINSTDSYLFGREQRRLEAKLSGQLTSKHSVVGSYLDLTDDQINNCFNTSCLEFSAIDPGRSTPQKKQSLTYNGILTNSFLLEGLYAGSELKFVSSGGDPGDFVNATNVYDFQRNAYAGAPTFSAVLGDKIRETENFLVKGTYYWSTRQIGTHNVVAGYDDFTQSQLENNSQSGSDFTIWTFTPTTRQADGTITPTFSAGDWIIYFPILQASQGSDLNTRSVFINDKWDLNSHWSFNLGARYDRNEGVDQAGASVADDEKISPRLGATYDVFGNGRLRFNATYGDYVSKIASGNVADAASPAGQPSYVVFGYGGETISGLPTREALAQLQSWFNSVGGINAGDFVLFGGTAGISSQIRNRLSSPYASEYTFGVSTQIGQRAFVRADYQHREWDNFYGSVQTLDTGKVLDPLAGVLVDVVLTENVPDFTREYDAVLLQAAYRLTNRLNIGGNYTWSELQGNVEGETAGAGPTAPNSIQVQPELLAYANRNPIGFLLQDQRHKARAWVSYDQPTPLGNLNFSVLQRFDSGTPYSAIGLIDVHQRAACPQCPANPGYESASTNNAYYFGERGAFRWDDLTATDLALNYTLPLGRAAFFFQGEVINVLNEDAQVLGDTTVLTASSSACRQSAAGPTPGARCLAFNPFTETPVEGVHYVFGPQFGQATTPTTQLVAGHFQLPRTFRFSAGFRF
jgi:hypothetical protein